MEIVFGQCWLVNGDELCPLEERRKEGKVGRKEGKEGRKGKKERKEGKKERK
ncbi:hypothetical protein L345_09552, partial [Ophiophagus hannah]